MATGKGLPQEGLTSSPPRKAKIPDGRTKGLNKNSSRCWTSWGA